MILFYSRLRSDIFMNHCLGRVGGGVKEYPEVLCRSQSTLERAIVNLGAHVDLPELRLR